MVPHGEPTTTFEHLASTPRFKLHQGPPPEDSTELPFMYISLKEQIDVEAKYNVENCIDRASEKLLGKAHDFVEEDQENVHIYNLKMDVNWTYGFVLLKKFIHVTMSGTPAIVNTRHRKRLSKPSESLQDFDIQSAIEPASHIDDP